MKKARWITVLYLCLAMVSAFIPVRTTRASNSVNGSFSVPDTVPPAVINLFATIQSYTSVTLSWIAPGDDGNIGVAAVLSRGVIGIVPSSGDGGTIGRTFSISFALSS